LRKGCTIVTTLTRTAPTPAPSTLKRLLARRPLSAYFGLAFALSWALILPMTLSTNLGIGLLPYALPDALGIALFLLASVIGPTAAALIVAGITEGRAGVGALLRPIARWRIRPHWYLAALLLDMAIRLLAFSLVLGPGLLHGALGHWPLLVTTFLPGFAILLIPSLNEEPGWRGFALPRLQARYGPLGGSLILGLMHGLWHLPALGTIMLGPFTLAQVPPFLLTAIGITFIYTWLFNRTGQSTLIVVLFHAASNAASQWLNALFEQGAVVLPEAGLAGWLISGGWLNVLAYGSVGLLLVALTRGRLGLTPDRSDTANEA
jgi:membrane protease YdiL (CAAX protease family)